MTEKVVHSHPHHHRPPLWMPRGSVRGILALIIVIGYVVLLAADWSDMPEEIVMAVLGFYFLERKGN